MIRLAFTLLPVLSALGCDGKGPALPPASERGASRQLQELATMEFQAEWPTYHGGYTLDGVAPVAPPDNPVRLWRFKAEGRLDSTPVSGAGKVYLVTSKGAVTALDLAGRPLWNVRIEKEIFLAPLLYVEPLVVIGSEAGTLHALEAATGKGRWSYDVGGPVTGSANRVDLPGGKKGVIATSQSDGSIHCVDLETGKGLWKTPALERCDGSAGVGGGRIVMGSCASALHVFSVEKAAKTADIELGEDDQVAGGVAFSGKLAFAGTRGGKVYAVDVAEGKVVWKNADSQREAFSTPAVDERFVLFGSDDGRVYALKRATGVKVWDSDTGEKPLSPVIAGNRVVVSSGGTLFLLDLETGRKIWSERVSDAITSPALVGGMMIVGADDGTVSAFGSRP